MCKHKVFNEKCLYCNEVMHYCGLAEKEGYNDFGDCYDGHGQITKEGWQYMLDYYNWALSYDADYNPLDSDDDLKIKVKEYPI